MRITGPFHNPKRKRSPWYLSIVAPVISKAGTPVVDAEGRVREQRTRPHYESKAKAEADIARLRGQAASAGVGSFVLSREAQREYERARAILPPGVALETAAEFWVKHHPTGETLTVETARERFLAHVAAVNGEERHHNDLKSRTLAFVRKFPGRAPGTITRGEVMSYLLEIPGAARSKLNHKRALCTFFNWLLDDAGAIDHNPAGGIKRKKLPKILPKEIQFLDLVAVNRYLRAFERYDPELVAHEVIQLFAGVRADDEMASFRAEWVKAATREVVTPAEMTKTGRREVISELEANFWEWWRCYGGQDGPVRPRNYEPRWLRVRALLQIDAGPRRDELAREPIAQLLKALGRPTGWPWNARRRTFCTYHVAKHQSAAKTALILRHRGEAGTLHESYRGLGVTQQQGEAYFAIMPQKVEHPILPRQALRGIVRPQSARDAK